MVGLFGHYFFNLSIAQDTLMIPSSGNGGFKQTCTSIVFDEGGVDGNYLPNSNGYIIFYQTDVEYSLHFLDFELEEFFDEFYVFKGVGIGGELIGKYSGNQLKGQTLNVGDEGVTLQLISDATVERAGVEIQIACNSTLSTNFNIPFSAITVRNGILGIPQNQWKYLQISDGLSGLVLAEYSKMNMPEKIDLNDLLNTTIRPKLVVISYVLNNGDYHFVKLLI